MFSQMSVCIFEGCISLARLTGVEQQLKIECFEGSHVINWEPYRMFISCTEHDTVDVTLSMANKRTIEAHWVLLLRAIIGIKNLLSNLFYNTSIISPECLEMGRECFMFQWNENYPCCDGDRAFDCIKVGQPGGNKEVRR